MNGVNTCVLLQWRTAVSIVSAMLTRKHCAQGNILLCNALRLPAAHLLPDCVHNHQVQIWVASFEAVVLGSGHL